MAKRPWPNWTVVYSVTRPKACFIGKGVEFFYNEDIAKFCYDEQVVLGNEATLRRFHPSDKFYMNPIEVNACSDELSGGY